MEKEKTIEEIAENFTSLPEDVKDKLAWYLLGRQDEQKKNKIKSA